MMFINGNKVNSIMSNDTNIKDYDNRGNLNIIWPVA